MHSIRTAAFIAYKSIVRGRRGTLILMLLILSLSFFNMLFVPSVFSGLLNTITGLLTNTTTSSIVVSPEQVPIPKTFISNETRLRAQIQTIPGVLGTTRTYLTAGSISFDPDKNGVYKRVSAQIIGIDPDQVDNALSLKQYLVAGRFLAPTDTDQILLPAALAGGYGLPVPTDLGGATVGDKVDVTYGNGVMRQYTVKGIVNITFGTALTNTYITTREADSVLGASDQASQILVKVDMKAHPLSYYKARIQALAPTLKVQPYSELLAVIQSVLDAFTLIALIVSVISIAVAAVTIFVMIYINAVGKRRQIGILKAIGIKERIIVYSYVFQSLFYVVCGILAGLAFVFGILLPVLSRYPIMLPFGPMQFSFSASLVGESIVGLIIAGFFSGVIPARLVAREKILTAIWG
jgi:putative ABC transport system permease protein